MRFQVCQHCGKGMEAKASRFCSQECFDRFIRDSISQVVVIKPEELSPDIDKLKSDAEQRGYDRGRREGMIAGLKEALGFLMRCYGSEAEKFAELLRYKVKEWEASLDARPGETSGEEGEK